VPINEAAIIGCLLGGAVGDAIGLPCEGLSPSRQRRRFGSIEGHRLILGRGMVSDDTEHACLNAQALIASAGEADVFRRELARQLRHWLASVPPGTGLATLKACARLGAGVGPERSGVFSAGNGPAMRAAIIGVVYGNDPIKLRELIAVSSRITHTDPKAEYGAFAIALAAHWSCAREAIEPHEFCRKLQVLLPESASELIGLVEQAAASATAGDTTHQFAESLGLTRGFGGYTYHTVPGVLHAWFRHPDDYRAAILEIVHCGGDTDSTAAILGGIVGARVGKIGIPDEWLRGLWEWPRGVSWMEGVGQRLAAVAASAQPQRKLPVLWPVVLLRNLIFLTVVLAHGFRRLLPPY